MAVAFMLGGMLLCLGLGLLWRHSYENLPKEAAGSDAEMASIASGEGCPKPHNDCFLPYCFFDTTRVRNYETWIVLCLVSGSLMLILGME
jgi:hypothetical protein